jgi:hypothetical protein
LDVRAWLASLTERDRDIVESLMIGDLALDVANKYKISPARISQKRREFRPDWIGFCGDGVPAAVPNGSANA